MTSRRLIVFFIVLLGTILRLWISSNSIGTNDAVNWYQSAESILSYGLVEAYKNDPYLNNPPLISLLVSQLLLLSEKFQLPFPFLLRLPGCIAEAGTGLLIYVILQKRVKFSEVSGLAIYMFSLLNLLIAGYHGHTDPLVTFFTLSAIWLAYDNSRPFYGGLSLSLALNIKLIPLLILPVLFFGLIHNRQRFSFLLGISLGFIPFLVALYTYGYPFYEKVFGYRSILDYWGIQLFLVLFATNYQNLTDSFMQFSKYYHQYGPLLIIVIVSLLGLIYRKRTKNNPYVACGLIYSIFAVLASGFGLPYVSLFVPFYIIGRIGKSFRFTLLAGLVIVLTYNTYLVRTWPFQSIHIGSSPKWVVLGMFIVWVTIATWIWELSNELVRGRWEVKS
jgi:hypothetical protein